MIIRDDIEPETTATRRRTAQNNLLKRKKPQNGQDFAHVWAKSSSQSIVDVTTEIPASQNLETLKYQNS